MVKALETSFKRIEKKYVLDKEKLGAIWDDLKEHLVEDDYPTSTITNIYFDTADFQVIQDSIAKKMVAKRFVCELTSQIRQKIAKPFWN